MSLPLGCVQMCSGVQWHQRNLLHSVWFYDRRTQQEMIYCNRNSRAHTSKRYLYNSLAPNTFFAIERQLKFLSSQPWNKWKDTYLHWKMDQAIRGQICVEIESAFLIESYFPFLNTSWTSVVQEQRSVYAHSTDGPSRSTLHGSNSELVQPKPNTVPCAS